MTNGSSMGLWRQRRFWVVFLLLFIATTVIGQTRPVAVASNAIWDAFEAYQANVDAELSKKVLVIEIIAKDYERQFRSTSPLDIDPLARLTALILYQRPQKLVVDLDTSDARFNALRPRVADVIRCLRNAKSCGQRTATAEDREIQEMFDTIVWARDAASPRAGETAFELRPVLGISDPEGRMPFSAAAIARPDDDGRLRHIAPFIPIGHAVFPTVPVAGRPRMDPREAIEDVAELRAHGEPIRLRILPSLRRLAVSEAGEFLTQPANLKDKTVFLGGSYDTRDTFLLTDGAEYPSVEVMAAAAMALAAGDTVKDLPQVVEIAFDVLLALAVAWIHHTWPRWGAVLVVAVAIPGALLGLRSLGYAMGYVLNLVALVIGVSIHQMVSDVTKEPGK